MSNRPLLALHDALALITANGRRDGSELIPVATALGRVLAEDLHAKIDQPPAEMSAMDGYAIWLQEPLVAGLALTVGGEAAAGHPFDGAIPRGTAIRVFTGSVLPDRANHVILQEHVEREGARIILTKDQPTPHHTRARGCDFQRGTPLFPKGHRIGPTDIALLTSAGWAEIPVVRRPRIALFASGDELQSAGEPLANGQIYDAVAPGLAALFSEWGADVTVLERALDTQNAVAEVFEKAADADLVCPIGGASVGDYDLMKPVARRRFTLHFEKVAVKPGKPVWFGTNATQSVIGLPGNPASALACAHLFARHWLDLWHGETRCDDRQSTALLDGALPAGGPREEYLRAQWWIDAHGQARVRAFSGQDSSFVRVFAHANALLHRAPNALETKDGERVSILRLSDPL